LFRTARLLELMVGVQARPRFTATELAEECGVSRRTILRDLQVLSEMGVLLRSTPGRAAATCCPGAAGGFRHR
jgi:predicted DNA-binding transcriptional regulator YafY